MDIRTKLTFVLVGVALFSMAALGWAIYGSAERALRESRLAQLEAVAEAERDALGQIVTAWRDRTELVASRTLLRQSLRSHNETGEAAARERIERSLSDAAESVEVVLGLSVHDARGRLVASVGDVVEPGGPTADPAPDIPVMRGVSRGADGGLRAELVTDLRLDGQELGTLGVALDARSLAAVLEDRTGLGRTGGTVIVVRGTGSEVHVLRTPGTDGAAGTSSPADGADPPSSADTIDPTSPAGEGGDLVRLALEGREGRYWRNVTDARGEAVWAAVRRVPETGWGVAVEMDAVEARAPLEDFRGQLVRLALALAAFAVLFATLLAARFSKPIHQLAEAARRVGSGELDARAPVSTRDEVGLLARTFNDMAERLEEQVAKLRELELLFDSSRDMLCIAGTDGYFKRINPAFERVLGWSSEEMLSRPFVDFVHPDDKERTRQEIEKLARGVPTVSFRNRYRHADGSYRTILWTAQPDPETDRIFAAGRDVTGRGEAEGPRGREGTDA